MHAVVFGRLHEKAHLGCAFFLCRASAPAHHRPPRIRARLSRPAQPVPVPGGLCAAKRHQRCQRWARCVGGACYADPNAQPRSWPDRQGDRMQANTSPFSGAEPSTAARWRRLTLALAFARVLGACGGGDGEPEVPAPAPSPTPAPTPVVERQVPVAWINGVPAALLPCWTSSAPKVR